MRKIISLVSLGLLNGTFHPALFITPDRSLIEKTARRQSLYPLLGLSGVWV
jgi:hypothetical protein